MDYSRRQEALRRELGRLRTDALLVTHLPNVRYLCGFTGSAGVLVVGGKRAVLFTDGRYTEQARAEVQGARVVIAKASALTAAAEWAAAQGVKSVGVEAQHLTLALRSAVKRAFQSPVAGRQLPVAGRQSPVAGGVRLRELGPIIENLRMVKDAEEVERIREAVNLGASLLDVALETIRPGVTEAEVAAQLGLEARRRGAEGMSFESIVAAGPRSALPHGRASQCAIPERGFVVLDFGVILAGYCSDMTRTVHVGKVSAADRKLYEAVREAQQAGVEAVKAGASCGDVDRAARARLRRAGLARYFTHSTGHGVGLEIHEAPRVARQRPERLQPGMVITIEPGVYVRGRAGVRIEDMVVVTGEGCEVLTPAPKQLIVL